MPVLHVEVVMGSEHITWNDRGKRAAMLLRIPTIHHVDHALGVAVPKITVVWRSIVYLKQFN